MSHSSSTDTSTRDLTMDEMNRRLRKVLHVGEEPPVVESPRRYVPHTPRTVDGKSAGGGAEVEDRNESRGY